MVRFFRKISTCMCKTSGCFSRVISWNSFSTSSGRIGPILLFFYLQPRGYVVLIGWSDSCFSWAKKLVIQKALICLHTMFVKTAFLYNWWRNCVYLQALFCARWLFSLQTMAFLHLRWQVLSQSLNSFFSRFFHKYHKVFFYQREEGVSAARTWYHWLHSRMLYLLCHCRLRNNIVVLSINRMNNWTIFHL